MKLIRKPIEIEGLPVKEIIRLHKEGSEENPRYPGWLAEWERKGNVLVTDFDIEIWVGNGFVNAGIEDWILCGANGEIYPASKSAIESGYEVCPE